MLSSSSALGMRLQGETPSLDKDTHTRCMYDNTPVGIIRLKSQCIWSPTEEALRAYCKFIKVSPSWHWSQWLAGLFRNKVNSLFLSNLVSEADFLLLKEGPAQRAFTHLVAQEKLSVTNWNKWARLCYKFLIYLVVQNDVIAVYCPFIHKTLLQLCRKCCAAAFPKTQQDHKPTCASVSLT